MSETTSETKKKSFPPLPAGMGPLWAGVLGAPAAWVLQLQAVYMLSPWACAQNHLHVLHAIDVACLLLTLGSGLVCLTYQRRGNAESDQDNRTHFLASLGLLSASLFVLVIIATTIATFMLDPCAT